MSREPVSILSRNLTACILKWLLYKYVNLRHSVMFQRYIKSSVLKLWINPHAFVIKRRIATSNFNENNPCHFSFYGKLAAGVRIFISFFHCSLGINSSHITATKALILTLTENIRLGCALRLAAEYPTNLCNRSDDRLLVRSVCAACQLHSKSVAGLFLKRLKSEFAGSLFH